MQRKDSATASDRVSLRPECGSWHQFSCSRPGSFRPPAAYAGDNGEGLVGETDDRIITFFSLGLVVFFTVFVIVASWIQGALDRRKQERKAVELRKRVGW